MIKILKAAFVFIVACLFSVSAFAQKEEIAAYLAGHDMRLVGEQVISHTLDDGVNTLVFTEGVNLTMGANWLSADKAVVWVEPVHSEYRGMANTDFKTTVYLEGNIVHKKGKLSRSVNLSESVMENGGSLVAGFIVTGQVFVTAELRLERDPSEMGLYRDAVKAVRPATSIPKVKEEARVPDSYAKSDGLELPAPKIGWVIPEFIFSQPEEEIVVGPVADSKDKFKYPVNIAGIWEPAPKVEKTQLPDGRDVATVSGRFYIWQQQDEDGNLLEFQADYAVIFFDTDGSSSSESDFKTGRDTGRSDILATGKFKSIYLTGDVVMSEGERTFRAEEIFYNLADKQALVVGGEMSTFDPSRGVPVYLRAGEIRQVSENVFRADDIVLTSDEFYVPKFRAEASSIVVTDDTTIEQRKRGEKHHQAEINEVSFKYGDLTFFKWNRIHTDFLRPELPIKKVQVINDSRFGTGVETSWYLSRLLGLKQPDNVDSTLALDYYSKRGFGTGAVIDYDLEDSFGFVNGYIIDDDGEDRLGRNGSRKNLEPDSDIRGRFTFRHREYLPYDWQLTVETSYISDKNFLESFYRSEYNTSKDQETVLHLKRIRDNWAFAWLAKGRINDFSDELEELPSAEFHLKGQSLWDDRLTYYGDSGVSRLRYRQGDDTVISDADDGEFFTFASTRHEIDMPFAWDKFKFVPYVAGTAAYDDLSGFTMDLDGDVGNGEEGVWLGESGVRMSTMFYRVDRSVKSRIWDLDWMKHTVKPHAELAFYGGSDEFEMRDMANLGFSQRWQTRRGPEGNKRTVDWIRLDVDTTWVSDSASRPNGPGRFMFNNPGMAMFERKSTINNGISRNTVDVDFSWQVSDTMAFMSDMNYDMMGGQVEQFDFGVTRYVWPRLSYYVGNRYLKEIRTGDEVGSNSLVYSFSYQLNPRYTMTFGQEYNFDFGKNVRSEMGLIRKYHRIYYGFTLAADESLDSGSIVFSIWPEGVKELAVGSRKYVAITDVVSYD